ncbi:extracellular solute-binding protein [Thiospirochaeta perfilievii]|uniref:Extracellular solute-binding protein n=1 Tax=Thiospirochaeta perfilievii TaxID=252967 RepID=A0A5C1QBE3_9SPIO|nr:ABC transporter substrate-binding protein [Thiospirochaeta perfilievii]QEN04370.1 extracellular solute-binding protein [Thiospirochaeta perfilievii]
MSKLTKISVLLALVVSLVLPVYSNGNQEVQSEDGTVTFTGFFSDPNPNWDNMESDTGKYIMEKTGVKLDVEMAVGDPEQKINLIAASGVYPDLISPKGASGALIEAGALLDLTELIDQHAPNIKAVLGDQMKRLRYSNDDKSIYFIPSDALNQYYYRVGGPFNLQLDVVKELGYPEIRTLEQYEAAIQAYVNKYPTIDGQKTIGLSLLADDWRIMISTTNPAFFATGAPDDGEFTIDPETFDAQIHYKRPAEREYFRWLNHMNDIGLLDQESFVQKYDQYIAKIASGRVLAAIDQDWEISQAVNSLKSEGKYNRIYGRFPVTLNKDYKIPVFQQTGFSGGWGLAITTSCKDPVKAIKFLDYLASEEGQIVVNWGLEGIHYNYDENGKRVIPDDVMDMKVNDNNKFKMETGIGNYLLSARYGDGNKDSTGNYFTTNNPEMILKDYSDLEKEVLAGYGATFWKDLFPKEDEFPVKPWGAAWNIPIPNDSPITVFQQKEQDIVRRLIPEAILATPAEFDEVYDQLLEELEAINATEMEKEYSKYIKKRIQLWND